MATRSVLFCVMVTHMWPQEGTQEAQKNKVHDTPGKFPEEVSPQAT